ncbi:hypothetical protein B6S44_24015 [Bosea sp. Tri-44]|uniref:hypothetical protein n=1 Tax=Bosea sp. Tri-44 TaxID=1972137 RepID=UPI00100E5FA6|nr:hypothetical protein [Bosea sp. Tri-44]RXT48138.1 hypothetical protein B6S44_24015 [Bosea sp. Tri-44]
MWQSALAHALLLDHDGDRVHADQADLNGRQLAEGARSMARTFALLIAEAPAGNKQELGQKIEIYETMSFLPSEMKRSRTASMVELAMHFDGVDLKRPNAAICSARGSNRPWKCYLSSDRISS